MESIDKKQITEWYAAHQEELSIELYLTGSSQDEALTRFCDELNAHAPNIDITRKKKEEGMPGIQVSESLIYHAIPEGSELMPFLEALSPSKDAGSQITEEIRVPQKLKLYISPGCPFCPGAVKNLLPLVSHPSIRLSIIDGFLFPEQAGRDNITSAPTTVLDENFRWTGIPDPGEIVRILGTHDPSQLSSDSLLEIINDGGASRVAEMMMEKKSVFPAFVDLLTDEKWSVRLGAMVSMEEIFDRDPVTGATVLPGLWERFDSSDGPIRGDIVYMVGVSGQSEYIPRLEEVAAGDFDEELREAAQEALEAIYEQTQTGC